MCSPQLEAWNNDAISFSREDLSSYIFEPFDLFDTVFNKIMKMRLANYSCGSSCGLLYYIIFINWFSYRETCSFYILVFKLIFLYVNCLWFEWLYQENPQKWKYFRSYHYCPQLMAFWDKETGQSGKEEMESLVCGKEKKSSQQVLSYLQIFVQLLSPIMMFRNIWCESPSYYNRFMK